MQEAVKGSELTFVTIPSKSFREIAQDLAMHVEHGSFIVSCTKGVEQVGDDFRLMSQILHEEIPQCEIGVVSGPNLAIEIAEGQIAGAVIASQNMDLVAKVQQQLQSSRFRIYGSQDVYGVELGGALKNIYAIICGMASALEVGQNSLAMIITRSLTEMCRFAASMGANPSTFLGLSGVGDLMATCNSKHSRNFQLGHAIGGGLTVSEAIAKLGKTAEGVNTLGVVYRQKNAIGLNMPLVDALYKVVMEGEDLRRKIVELMTGPADVDVEFTFASRSQ